MRGWYAFAWRDRVADPNYLLTCCCGHAEQHHRPSGCDVLMGGDRCLCDVFTEAKREWVGFASEKPR